MIWPSHQPPFFWSMARASLAFLRLADRSDPKAALPERLRLRSERWTSGFKNCPFYHRLPHRPYPPLCLQPLPPMTHSKKISMVAPTRALTIRATIPEPTCIFSRCSSQSPMKAPRRPTIKFPMSPNPFPRVTRPASHPAKTPTTVMTTTLWFDRYVAAPHNEATF
jgi:hypothetical protein